MTLTTTPRPTAGGASPGREVPAGREASSEPEAPAGRSTGVGTCPAPGADELAIAGLSPLSTVDWPGRLVATAFLQGCPWRCTYCHNPALLPTRTPGTVPWSRVRDLLERRAGLLDGVVFSGGEPTRQRALVAAVREARDLGFAVGLHTGGAYPARLAELLPLVDWVGLDVKATPERYAAVTRVASSARTSEASLRLVLDSGVPVQVRTTVDPTTLTPDDVDALRARMASLGVRDHVLQQVRPDGTAPEYAAALAAARRGSS